jgi:hypothetical protein
MDWSSLVEVRGLPNSLRCGWDLHLSQWPLGRRESLVVYEVSSSKRRFIVVRLGWPNDGIMGGGAGWVSMREGSLLVGSSGGFYVAPYFCDQPVEKPEVI